MKTEPSKRTRVWQVGALGRFRLFLISLIVGGGVITTLLEQRASLPPGFGFDTGRSPSDYLKNVITPLRLTSAHGRWLRGRSFPEPLSANLSAVNEQRAALLALRNRGFKSCIFLRFDPPTWKNGVRPGGGYRLPKDLLEVYARGAAYAAAYGDVVDVWEVDNEPDISFVLDNPEDFAAYHKAFYFGLRSAPERHTGPVRYASENNAKVLMAPMGVPPGPYFIRLLENDFLSYTDGFNYHYYGYHEDFTAVYRQFEATVRKASEQTTSPLAISKALPVFLTEYGYGLLSSAAGTTTEGRERQRRWFADVLGQISFLRPEAPFAFYMPPYLEYAHNEFGLFQRNAAPPADNASDFGGFRLRNGDQLSPALLYLLRFAPTHRYQPKPWTALVIPPSRVIVDFEPGSNMTQVKTHLGYQLSGKDPALAGLAIGSGRMIIYNFGEKPVDGTLKVGSGSTTLQETKVSINPGNRIELPVRLSAPADRLAQITVDALFQPDDTALPPARWRTSLMPAATGMGWQVVTALNHSQEASERARDELLKRPLAAEEPRLKAEGRWLVSRGVQVADSPSLWKFEITQLPAEPLRPAMAELPLPDSFVFLPGQILNLAYRLGRRQPAVPGALPPMLDLYFRTSTGNLYQVWPRQFPSDNWQSYWQHAENFGLSFFGRAEGHTSFHDQKPIALVFFFRPTSLPATFEIANAAIGTFNAP